MEPPKVPVQPPLRKNRIRARKKLTHVKRHVHKSKNLPVPESTVTQNPSDTAELPEVNPDSIPNEFEPGTSLEPLPDLTYSMADGTTDHDYCSRPSSSLSHLSGSVSLSDFSEDTTLGSDFSSGLMSPCPLESPSPRPATADKEPVCCTTPTPDITLNEIGVQKALLEARNKLFLMLPNNFVPLVDRCSVHILMVGRRESKAIQRQLIAYPSGEIKVQVHGHDINTNSLLEGVRELQPLTEDNVGYFVDRLIDITSNLRLLEICAGQDHLEYKEAWCESTQYGVIESDTYKECRYRETFRSSKCHLLVEAKHWRCKECMKLGPVLKRKVQLMRCETPHINTNIRYMANKHKDTIIVNKQKQIKKHKQTIDRLQNKIKTMIEKEGFSVESNLSKDLTDILQEANLSPNQSLFLQQQLKYAQCKKSSGMRWHPTLIRMALSLYLKAPGAYRELCDSGFVKLPSSRTLFDYSHVTKITPGIDPSIVEAVEKRAHSEEHTHKQYHVLMADEMHISKNLVQLKSTGELIGFKDLDYLDEELNSLQQHLDDPGKPLERQLASKVMAYMVKGVSSNLKHVVASYPCCNVSPKQMYIWTWDVIGALERSGVMIIAFICDGCSTNRAFIKLHKPATSTPSGVVFDTVNIHAPHRLLYFFSDVPHLLKTIRNAFYNSRKSTKNKKKSPRLLKKNGQFIVWDSIIKLYLSKKGQILRKSYKLNAQNVYPDSYSRMKVRPAAEVMSHTVGTDLLSQGWPGISETVDFILKVNNWFDLLNGAFSGHGLKTNNYRLNPYTIKDVEDFENGVNGSRFQELLDFLNYLDAWKAEVKGNINASISRTIDESGVEPLPDESFHALNATQEGDQEEEDLSSRNLLPHQTLVGIEMSCRAFISCTTFLLKEGITFINARVFCQDPLEQNFGRQRMAGGGSNNPNLNQFLHKQRGFSTIGELSAANKRGNTEVLQEDGDNSTEPLPKRRNTRKQK